MVMYLLVKSDLISKHADSPASFVCRCLFLSKLSTLFYTEFVLHLQLLVSPTSQVAKKLSSMCYDSLGASSLQLFLRY